MKWRSVKNKLIILMVILTATFVTGAGFGERAAKAESYQYKEPAGICLPDVVYDREIEATGTCGEGLSYVLDEDGLLTITGTGEIERRAFAEVPAINNVVIGEGVTAIGDEAFSNAWNIKSIVFPDSLKSIGNNAFGVCRSLQSVCIPKGVETIGDGAFSCCFEMVELSIPDSVNLIGENAFYGCVSLEKIAVAQNNEAYDSRNNCNALIDSTANKLLAGCKNTVIPAGVVTIGNSAFVSVEGLTAVVVSDGMKSIEKEAFYFCVDLQEIYIPESVETIADDVFNECDDKLVIYAVKNSYAWKYAEKNKIDVKEPPANEEKNDEKTDGIQQDDNKTENSENSKTENSNSDNVNNNSKDAGAPNDAPNNISNNFFNNPTANMSDSGNITYGSDSKPQVLKEQNLKVGKIKKYKAKRLKKKSVSFKLKVKFYGNGVVTYNVKGKAKYITVNKHGKVTLKKGIKKGVYKICITVSETDTYKKDYKIVKVKVK